MPCLLVSGAIKSVRLFIYKDVSQAGSSEVVIAEKWW
jgi:hypothetical protein